MNDAQQEILEIYGGDVICIDRTHGTNKYDIQLTSIIFRDNNYQGLPVAFLWSNRQTEEVFKYFFFPIKGRTGHTETRTADHKACGYANVIVDSEGKSVKPIIAYRGLDTVEYILEHIIKEKEELAQILTHTAPIFMTPQDEQNFRSATHCYICKKALHEDRVRDHCHISGKYQGPLHNTCNLKFRLQKKIPVIFHNLEHYDGHLIMQGLGKIKDNEITVIPTTMEKYIYFALTKKHNNIRVSLNFINSIQFMSTSHPCRSF